MASKSVESRPSETAVFVALHRTIAHKEYRDETLGPDYLAEYFLLPTYRFLLKFKGIRQGTRKKLASFLLGMTEYIIARTAYFDRLFVDALDSRIPQIVLMGAGYDTRAYRFAARNQGTRIFELDIPPTQDRKKKCIKNARIDVPESVSFVPIDFNNESLGDVLGRAGYQGDQKTLFIWEGVSYYLEPASVDQTLGFVRQTEHPESAIAFDYTVTITEENIDDYYGVREFAQSMQSFHSNEGLLFSIDDGEVASFLDRRGLRVVEHLDNEQIEQAFLRDGSGALIGHMTGHFRFVRASKKASG